MKKKKIAVIGLKGLPAYGGAATVGENIIKRLKNDYDFTVYAVESHVKDKNYNLVKQIVFNTFPIKKLNVLVYYLKSTFHVLFLEKYDLVHLHHIDAAFILFFIKLKYRVISTNHGMPYLHGKWPKYLVPYFKLNEKLHLKLSNKVIVVSKDLFRHFQKTKLSYKVKYIPNGTNSDVAMEFKNLKKYNIAFVAGRVIYIKGLHILMEAIQKDNTGCSLLVIGDLYHEKNYKRDVIDPLIPSINVTFKDVIYKKEDLFREIVSAEFFVFPSIIEAMSTVLLEVASLGIPIICSDIVQNRDIFNEQEVLFFKSESIIDLKEKINFALNNREKMEQKAQRARKKVNAVFSWSTICKEYSKVFGALIL